MVIGSSLNQLCTFYYTIGRIYNTAYARQLSKYTSTYYEQLLLLCKQNPIAIAQNSDRILKDSLSKLKYVQISPTYWRCSVCFAKNT